MGMNNEWSPILTMAIIENKNKEIAENPLKSRYNLKLLIMASVKNCWKDCLRGIGIPWWATVIVVALAGALIAASGGTLLLFGVLLVATLANIGIAVGAGAILTLGLCMLWCVRQK